MMPSTSPAVAEMAKATLSYVTEHPYSSFVEIIQHLGEPAKGDRVIELLPNLCVWLNVSDVFADAMISIHTNKEVILEPSCLLVYMVDGGFPSLPVAKHYRSYKKPHWLPVTISRTGHHAAGGR